MFSTVFSMEPCLPKKLIEKKENFISVKFSKLIIFMSVETKKINFRKMLLLWFRCFKYNLEKNSA